MYTYNYIKTKFKIKKLVLIVNNKITRIKYKNYLKYGFVIKKIKYNNNLQKFCIILINSINISVFLYFFLKDYSSFLLNNNYYYYNNLLILNKIIFNKRLIIKLIFIYFKKLKKIKKKFSY